MDETIVRSEYIDAFKPNGEKKEGCTRIDFNKYGEEITREYCTEDTRKKPSPALLAVMTATPEEIQKIRDILGITQ